MMIISLEDITDLNRITLVPEAITGRPQGIVPQGLIHLPGATVVAQKEEVREAVRRKEGAGDNL